ncbi:uracil-DNA glycosylase [Candidatus Shapirobacteria bacterium]|nr:uracil-DNA glycosylase [Candidatus Shapirobacteria bacterium]
MPTAKLLLPANIKPEKIRLIAICEALPEKKEDYFYSSNESLYVRNTIEAFKSGGLEVENVDDLLEKGIYLTVVVKEPRRGLVVSPEVIEKYSYDLEEELKIFPNIKAILLMGDAAIKALNFISRRRDKTRVIPAGSTYKIRSGKFYFGKTRVFPSYLPTGKNFLIEKSKRRMVAEDIQNALQLLQFD